MNRDLQIVLQQCGVTFSDIAKSEKVGILKRWNREFPDLARAARHGQRVPGIAFDNLADAGYGRLQHQEFFVLPDDPSGMPSCVCRSPTMPNLHELVSDTITRCDELVIVASDFSWSAVLVNHGSPQRVARYFRNRRDDLPAEASRT